jgi:hypothetical protein
MVSCHLVFTTNGPGPNRQVGDMKSHDDFANAPS